MTDPELSAAIASGNATIVDTRPVPASGWVDVTVAFYGVVFPHRMTREDAAKLVLESSR